MVTAPQPGFAGTCWIRKSDGLEVAVVTDSDPTSGRYKRQLRLKDLATGRHFWGTPDRLRRTFHPMDEAAQAALDNFPRWPTPRHAQQ